MLEDVGPGTRRLAELEPGDGMHVLGPLGLGFEAPPDGQRALLVGGGIGIAPLAIWQDELLEAGVEAAALLGFRGAEHAEGAALLRDARIATDDGSVGHHGLVTELLAEELDAGADATVYACGPPAMLEAVRALCAERGAPAQLALESGMACGFGACFGCVVPTTRGYVRLCVDGPVLDAAELETAPDPRDRAPLMVEFCGIELAHPIVNGSGTFDAIAARRVFGDALLERFPFAAFVSKTITVEPRAGQPAAAAVGAPGRADQLDRAARTRAWPATWPRTCPSSRDCRCR